MSALPQNTANQGGKPSAGDLSPADALALEDADLTVQGLTKSFDDDTHVLKGVNFSVARGEAVSLIGANGAGKTTLMRACMRLIEPDGGSIILLDEDVTHLKRKALQRVRSRVGFVFQKHNLCPRLSALTNVIHGAQARRSGPGVWLQSLAPREIREEAMDCLDRVGLTHIAGRRVDQLSGGQSQRVAIARALMQRPQFMMADEPVASLDPMAGEEVMDLFLELIRNEGLTLLFTSHNLEHALKYSDRVLGIRDGRIALDTRPALQDEQSLRGIYD